MTDDLVKRLRADAEAYRQSLAAPTSHDMFTLAYQWQDKKHRHVWDLCSRLETAADRIERLEAALREVLFWTDDCNECVYDDEWSDIETRARKALEGKDD